MGTYLIEVTEFKSEVAFDLQGHLEAAMAAEATKMAIYSVAGLNSRARPFNSL